MARPEDAIPHTQFEGVEEIVDGAKEAAADLRTWVEPHGVVITVPAQILDLTSYGVITTDQAMSGRLHDNNSFKSGFLAQTNDFLMTCPPITRHAVPRETTARENTAASQRLTNVLSRIGCRNKAVDESTGGQVSALPGGELQHSIPDRARFADKAAQVMVAGFEKNNPGRAEFFRINPRAVSDGSVGSRHRPVMLRGADEETEHMLDPFRRRRPRLRSLETDRNVSRTLRDGEPDLATIEEFRPQVQTGWLHHDRGRGRPLQLHDAEAQRSGGGIDVDCRKAECPTNQFLRAIIALMQRRRHDDIDSPLGTLTRPHEHGVAIRTDGLSFAERPGMDGRISPGRDRSTEE